MKKTLVALAVLAVAGTASAQVKLTGGASFGYASKTVSNNATAANNGTFSGFGSDGTNLNVSATEDLGNGLTATVKSGFENTNYSSNVTGTGTDFSLAGGFGTLLLQSTKESCNGIVGQAAGVNLDEAGFGCAKSETDNIVYTLPAFGPVTAKFLIGDSDYKAGTPAVITSAAKGQGAGDVGAQILYLNFAQGPVAAAINFTRYEAANAGKNMRTRMTGSFDAGVAKVSAGYSVGGVTSGKKNTQVVLGASVPMGALSLGLGYGRTDKGGDGTASGFGVAGVYSLSKATSLTVKAANYTGAARTADRNFQVTLGTGF